MANTDDYPRMIKASILFSYSVPVQVCTYVPSCLADDTGAIAIDFITSSNLPHVGKEAICNHFSNTVLQQVTDRSGL